MAHVFPIPKIATLPVALALVLAGLGPGASDAIAHSPGTVYTLTNSPTGNAVKVFDRAGDGSLSAAGEFATGGTGTGGGLGSQSAVVLDGKRLLAVNPGSDSISAFKVKKGALQLIATVPSGGAGPFNITVPCDAIPPSTVAGFSVRRFAGPSRIILATDGTPAPFRINSI